MIDCWIVNDDDLTRAVEWNDFVVGGVGEVSSAQCAPPAACSPDEGGPGWLRHRRPRLLVAPEAESVQPHVLQAGVRKEHGVAGDETWIFSFVFKPCLAHLSRFLLIVKVLLFALMKP